MIEKITPLTVITTFSVIWFMYSTIFDYRRYRFCTMPFIMQPNGSLAREIELEKLGKIYKYKEHLTKSMYK